MIPSNQQFRDITARWNTLNGACASSLKLGGWMIIVLWNSHICSINFETCTRGHFSFAVYIGTPASRFFLVVDCICCQIRKQVLLARFSLNQKAGVASKILIKELCNSSFRHFEFIMSTNKEFQVFTEM